MAEKLEVGQEVRLFEGSRSKYSHQPEDGWPAVIASVGRKYVTLRRLDWPEDHWAIARGKYDIESGRRKQEIGTPDYFLTLPQLVQRKQRDADEAFLKTHKVTMQYPRPTDEVIHVMAEALRSHFEGEQS